MLVEYVCYLSTYVIGVRMLLEYVYNLSMCVIKFCVRMLFEYVCYLSTLIF